MSSVTDTVSPAIQASQPTQSQSWFDKNHTPAELKETKTAIYQYFIDYGFPPKRPDNLTTPALIVLTNLQTSTQPQWKQAQRHQMTEDSRKYGNLIRWIRQAWDSPEFTIQKIKELEEMRTAKNQCMDKAAGHADAKTFLIDTRQQTPGAEQQIPDLDQQNPAQVPQAQKPYNLRNSAAEVSRSVTQTDNEETRERATLKQSMPQTPLKKGKATNSAAVSTKGSSRPVGRPAKIKDPASKMGAQDATMQRPTTQLWAPDPQKEQCSDQADIEAFRSVNRDLLNTIKFQDRRFAKYKKKTSAKIKRMMLSFEKGKEDIKRVVGELHILLKEEALDSESESLGDVSAPKSL